MSREGLSALVFQADNFLSLEIAGVANDEDVRIAGCKPTLSRECGPVFCFQLTFGFLSGAVKVACDGDNYLIRNGSHRCIELQAVCSCDFSHHAAVVLPWFGMLLEALSD